MKRLLLALGLTLGFALPAQARDIIEMDITCTTTNVTVTTTTETIAVQGGVVPFPRSTGSVCIYGYAHLTTGANTATVTPRIQRGAAVTGTVVGDSVALTIGAAAGSEEIYSAYACEDRANVGNVQYNFSLEQASATGNGTVLQACIQTFVLQ